MWVVMIGDFEDGGLLDGVGAFGPYTNFKEAASAVPKLMEDRYDDEHSPYRLEILKDFKNKWGDGPEFFPHGYQEWMLDGIVQISIEPLTKG